MFTKIWWVHTVFTKKEEKKEWRKVSDFPDPAFDPKYRDDLSDLPSLDIYSDPRALETVCHCRPAGGHGYLDSCHLADCGPLAPNHRGIYHLRGVFGIRKLNRAYQLGIFRALFGLKYIIT